MVALTGALFFARSEEGLGSLREHADAREATVMTCPNKQQKPIRIEALQGL